MLSVSPARVTAFRWSCAPRCADFLITDERTTKKFCCKVSSLNWCATLRLRSGAVGIARLRRLSGPVGEPVIDGLRSQRDGDEHRDGAGAEHRWQLVGVARHLSGEDESGHRGVHRRGEEA